MNPGFFKSLWRLIYSQLESFNCENADKAKKLLKDLFSTTFGKSVEYADEDEKMSMANLLKERAEIVSSTAESSEIHPMICKAILILAESLTGPLSESIFDEFKQTVFSFNEDEIFQSLTSPVLNRVLSGYLSNVDDFINLVESRVIVPLLSRANPDEEYKKSLLLTSCPTLVTSIEAAMDQAIRDMDEWCHADNRTGSDIELTFFALLNSGKVGLFRQLPNTDTSTALREKFLTTLGISLRLAQTTSALPTTVEVQERFFYIPKVGIVMDRWLDKELKKYNELVVSRMNDLVVQKQQVKKIEELRGLIRGCFVNPASTILLPFGRNIDGVIGKFMSSVFEDINVLPCAMTSESIRKIVMSPIGGGFFQFDDMNMDKMRLTDLGASAKTAIPVVSQPTVSAAPSDGSEDLIDILLRELLQRLPDHAFLHRSHPVKVQPGVYRFGAREVTFHTKGGSLFVYRVGDYVSESDGVEFVAREFGVPVTKLKSSTVQAAAVVAGVSNFEGPSRFSEETRPAGPSITAGMRRPMDWDNDELMFRIVRRGLKAGDRVWREGWYNFCRQEGVSQDPRAQKKDGLAKFLELNMAHAARQEWAKNLLYFIRDDDVSFPPPSDAEGEELNSRQTSVLPSFGGSIIPGKTSVGSSADHPNYKTRLCMMFQQNRCTRGSACGFAHGEGELRTGSSGTGNIGIPPTQFYKTRMCNAFLEGRCTRGAGCSYAHSEAERVASASGVPRRDMKITEDLRLAEKRKAMMYNGRSPSPVPVSKSQRTSRHDEASKPLPYIAPARSTGRKDGSRVDENEL